MYLLVQDKETEEFDIVFKHEDEDDPYPYMLMGTDCVYDQDEIDNWYCIIKEFSLKDILNLK